VSLGAVYNALALQASHIGDHGNSVNLARTALRHVYRGSDPRWCATCHQNLGDFLALNGGEPRVATAHRLAGALIGLQGRLRSQQDALNTLVQDLAESGSDAMLLPDSFDQLCAVVEQINGVQFRDLFERLPRVEPDGDAALRKLIGLARDLMGKRLEKVDE
jgi:hypothetical protein